jgi:hypothetical protein
MLILKVSERGIEAMIHPPAELTVRLNSSARPVQNIVEYLQVASVAVHMQSLATFRARIT